MPKIHPIAAKLLADIEAYRLAVDIDRTTFGKKAAHDGHFIARVENGRLPRITTIEQVYKYMARTTSAVRHPASPVITTERSK